MLYYLHPDVGFFKGNGFKSIGPYLDMPGEIFRSCRQILALVACVPRQ
jgi:hypothetical protein